MFKCYFLREGARGSNKLNAMMPKHIMAGDVMLLFLALSYSSFLESVLFIGYTVTSCLGYLGIIPTVCRNLYQQNKRN